MEKVKKFWAFQINKTIIFEVEYYQLKGNSTPHFTTSASKFNQPKTDWIQCGQAQQTLLPRNSLAYDFYKYWNDKHLKDLSQKEYKELCDDIEALKKCYNHIELEQDKNLWRTHISFNSLKNLSMQKLPSKNNTPQKFEI